MHLKTLPQWNSLAFHGNHNIPLESGSNSMGIGTIPHRSHATLGDLPGNYTGLTWNSLHLMWIAMQSTRMPPNVTELSGEFTYGEVISLEIHPIPNEFRRNHVYSHHIISISNGIPSDLCKFACGPCIFKGVRGYDARIRMECM